MTEEATYCESDVEQEMHRLNTLFAAQRRAFRQQPVSNLQQRRNALSRLQQLLNRNSEELTAPVKHKKSPPESEDFANKLNGLQPEGCSPLKYFVKPDYFRS
ncbi:MAG: hypothetical protein K8R55_07195 [Desulfuromonadaceae bacterium]|nr:hypothetical protein [Desulfuromonadaceae bacterium]